MQSRCADSANWPMKAKFFAPGERVALGDLLDVAGDALVQRRHGAGLPLRLGDVRAEDIRVAEGLVLRRDLAP